MSVTEALLGTAAETKTRRIIETASAVARTGDSDRVPQAPSTQGAAEVLEMRCCTRCGNEWDARTSSRCNECEMTLGDLRQQEASLWRRLEAAEQAMRKTIEGQTWLRLRTEWTAISLRLERAESNGRSPAMACDQQAEPLRRLVAAGVRPTVNEAY